ncbi:MAG: hypothetical protein ACKV2O_00965 [Acidimicrobiales bacterium]
MTVAQFDPERVLQTLQRYGVRFVVIGGLAGSLYGSPHVTFDLDLTPDPAADNLERLAAALRELNARIRTEGVEDGLAFDCSGAFLSRVELLNLVTSAGEVDLAMNPIGTGGYAALAKTAITVDIRGTRFLVAALEEVIRSKETADRPKDRLTLPALRALLELRPPHQPD